MDRLRKMLCSFALILCCVACTKAHQLQLSGQEELVVICPAT